MFTLPLNLGNSQICTYLFSPEALALHSVSHRLYGLDCIWSAWVTRLSNHRPPPFYWWKQTVLQWHNSCCYLRFIMMKSETSCTILRWIPCVQLRCAQHWIQRLEQFPLKRLCADLQRNTFACISNCRWTNLARLFALFLFRYFQRREQLFCNSLSDKEPTFKPINVRKFFE